MGLDPRSVDAFRLSLVRRWQLRDRCFLGFFFLRFKRKPAPQHIRLKIAVGEVGVVVCPPTRATRYGGLTEDVVSMCGRGSWRALRPICPLSKPDTFEKNVMAG
jgi:hypothetical protein